MWHEQIKQRTNDMKNKSSLKTLTVTLLAAAFTMLIPEMSLASDPAGIGGMLCGVAGWFQSDTGKAIATIAIIFLGIAAFFGKVTWGLALMFAVGIFAIFGASGIVDAVNGDGGEGCGGTD